MKVPWPDSGSITPSSCPTMSAFELRVRLPAATWPIVPAAAPRFGLHDPVEPGVGAATGVEDGDGRPAAGQSSSRAGGPPT